jgi:SAM-dependent methyltransferase
MGQSIPTELIEAARGYESLFVPALFEPWTKYVIEGAGVRQGSHVLDVACGTGVLARGALAQTGPGGRVVGADPAPGMLAAGKEIEPCIDWILCGAEALELEDETFDCVISQFGLMFFKDRRQSADEMFRVLKPDGSLAIAVWNTVENNPAYEDVIELLLEQVGMAAADALRLPYSLGDAGSVTTILDDVGFSGIGVETKILPARFPSSRHMVEAELRGWLPLFNIFLSEAEINDVLVASDRMLSKYASSSGEAAFPMSAHIITARKK